MGGTVCNNCATPLPPGSKYCNSCGTPVPEKGSEAPASRPDPPNDIRHALELATAGDYEIHHEVGRGGMGRVFLAREIALDRLVALKVLPPSLMFDDSLVERFMREARLVAQLHHPNIISIFSVYNSHNLCFYSMNYVPGRTLTQVMHASPVLPLPEVERILSEAAAGLAYAHRQGVVHRDIKPGNLLIDGDNHVHVSDFGIAKALSANTTLTDTGAVIGTPQYMAPEQYEGVDVDGRADQYSLAVVGYQLLCGHCPFESESMKELLYRHLFSPPRPVNATRPETPMPLRDAIHKALSKDRADRFDTMDDFKAAIEGNGPPIFVSWLDSASGEKSAVEDTGRRKGDVITGRALGAGPVLPSALPTPVEVDSQWGVPTLTRFPPYQRALAGLAVAVAVLATTAVLAISRGGALSELLAQREANDSDAPSQVADGPLADQAAMLGALGSAEDQAEPMGEPASIDGEETTPPAAPAIALDGKSSVDAAVLPESGVELASGAASPAANALASGGAVRRPAVREDERPAVPDGLRSELQTILAQGKVLHDMGMYLDAADAYKSVMRRVTEASPENFSNGGVLMALWVRADSAIAAARTACELENQPSCP
ncbi:MAG: serine/threonine-protein kinase [Candidatus Palauibacterales bacterium]|nr:serine/threonine-protein kinase [Candidatus Palauibacterales bacterium]